MGTFFVVPRLEEALGVNGHAWVVRDADVLERMRARGKRPSVAVGIEVEECFLHCAEAFKRSELPSLGRMFYDQKPCRTRAWRSYAR